ncbi:antizyme inhibitor 2 [Caerostris extrusa]|uniref:Antizyme inhibitor 2 n=1 Tax=Caerostris extrusa TaxID=172846 RepID=A0AAV4QNN9_CAEEX|nr:antizyme inhibitor 2 [Caerostris extrusa]
MIHSWKTYFNSIEKIFSLSTPDNLSIEKMNHQNGHIDAERNDAQKDFYQILAERTKGEIYESSFDFISKATQEMQERRSFNTFDLADVLMKVQMWKQKMPYIRPFYAVKTNSDPVLLKLLVLLGFSFDCASEGEIRFVLEAGGDPKNIIFAHVIKPPGALLYAASVGVDLMTFDSKEELLKINKLYPQSRLLLRLSPQDVKCSFDLSDKFGCDVKEAEDVLTFAKNLNLNVIGISFHVGGLCQNSHSYAATIRASRDVFELGKQLGFEFTILDIGGGFTGSKGSEKLFNEISQVIKSNLKEYFSETDIEIIAEPGTFFACSAVSLTTAICGKKERNIQYNGTNPIRRFYYLNDSIYGSFFHGVEQYGFVLKPLLNELELRQRPVYSSTLWGQTCCGEDLLLKEHMLPDMEEGECIVWENMGAYCRVICSTFCGVPLPAAKYIFINNPRLNMEWLNNSSDVVDFLSRTCSLVEKEW